jgi:predicted DNA-binding protein
VGNGAPDILAKRTGRSKHFYAREAILEHLDKQKAFIWPSKS